MMPRGLDMMTVNDWSLRGDIRIQPETLLFDLLVLKAYVSAYLTEPGGQFPSRGHKTVDCGMITGQAARKN